MGKGCREGKAGEEGKERERVGVWGRGRMDTRVRWCIWVGGGILFVAHASLVDWYACPVQNGAVVANMF